MTEKVSASPEETAASAVFSAEKAETEPSAAAEGGPTLGKFLRTALLPVGRVMYVWSGGWNEADDGAGEAAVSLGLAPAWEAFAETADASYNYKLYDYRIHDGLDCTGFLGWAVYNTLETENGRPGYVILSTNMAASFAERGLGSLVTDGRFLPGDVVSMKGHVWLSLGKCEDGSVLFVHSSPPGVRLCGTLLADGTESQASAAAERLMREYCPEWTEKYPDSSKPIGYLDPVACFRFDPAVLPDPEGLADMDPETLMKVLWEE
jgi:hypothetical protein